MPCPHFDVKIIQRSKRQSAVASAAYQSGERLFSEYDQKQKYYSHKSEIVHTEIMLPPHAPPEYADRNTLWNAAEAIEKQWNSQLARRLVLAIPRDIPPEQQADLIRDYCREFFVSKGMIADFAIHDKGDGNPHAHILLTMRAMDEQGKWLPKSRKVYDLDENGERIRLASGRWKSHKEDTVDWNDQKYAEIWRQGWADTANRYLEAIGSPERLDLRSYARQGIDKIPTVHMGPAVSQLEKKGIQTNIGNLNRDIKAANSLMQSIRQMVRSLKGWLSGLKEKKAALLEALEQAKEPTIPELLSRYLDMRSEERTGWTSKGKLKGTVGDFNKVMEALDFLRQKEISTVESLDAYLDKVSGEILSAKTDIRKSERRIKAIDTTLSHIANHGAYKEVYKKYASIGWKTRKEKFAAEHREELDAYLAAKRFFKAHSGYECELSIHLATAYISFAPVRVLRTGAFCFFQLFSEKRTQEPSPERVRSERGREDKPLTPVLYSTREGGELYGAIFFRQGKNTTSVRRISKENFGRRSEKPPSHSCETRSTRSYFFGFERKRTRAAFHNGRIRKRLFPFSSVRL